MAKKAARYQKRMEQKQERADANRMRREQFNKRQRNKKIINYILLVIVLAAVVYAISLAIKPKDTSGEYDAFAQCLTDSGVVMYGTDWCPHCQAQKQRFGNSFRYVNYVNCDLNGAACDLAGVEGYPTWTFPAGPSSSGEQELEDLASRSGCTL